MIDYALPEYDYALPECLGGVKHHLKRINKIRAKLHTSLCPGRETLHASDCTPGRLLRGIVNSVVFLQNCFRASQPRVPREWEGKARSLV